MIEQKNPPQENNPLREQMEMMDKLNEIVRSYVANQLAKPFYSVKRHIAVGGPEHDTLSRLEALANPQIEETRMLLGAFFPLAVEDAAGDWIFVGVGKGLFGLFGTGDQESLAGVIMRFRPPPKDSSMFNLYCDRFLNSNEITTESPASFLRDPAGVVPFAQVVYRTDAPTTSPKKVMAQIEEDLKRAKKVAIERRKIIDEQKREAVKTFLGVFRPNSPQE